MNTEELGRKVQQEREKRGWSREQLAEKSGVSEGTIGSLENGLRQTRRSKIRAILRALNIADEDLGVTVPPDEETRQHWSKDALDAADIVGAYIDALPPGEQKAEIGELFLWLFNRERRRRKEA